jgi:NAD(P)-dependent dehydrogenase (short-subunit alcohol dehydrogenase family)
MCRPSFPRGLCVQDIVVHQYDFIVYGPQDLFTTPDAHWERFFAVNVLSGVRLSRAYWPAMKEHG